MGQLLPDVSERWHRGDGRGPKRAARRAGSKELLRGRGQVASPKSSMKKHGSLDPSIQAKEMTSIWGSWIRSRSTGLIVA